MAFTSAGITIDTEDETFEALVTAFEAQTGLSVDRTRDDDQLVPALLRIVARALRARDEERVEIFNAGSPRSASGLRLHEILSLVTEPQSATYTTDTAAITATAGTSIPVGSLVEINDTRFQVTQGVTATGSGDTVIIQALEAGDVALPASTALDIVTPVVGWTGITSSAAPSIGRARESDSAFYTRATTNPSNGYGNINAVRAALLKLSFITAAEVVENTSSSAATVDGISMTAHSVAVIVWPNTLTTAQKEQAAAVIHQRTAMATEYIPTSSADVTVQVTNSGGGTTEVRFDYATSVTIPQTTNLTLAAGYELADVESEYRAAVIDYYSNLTVGQTVRRLEQAVLAAGIEGIVGADIKPNGIATDYTPNRNEIVLLGTHTVG